MKQIYVFKHFFLLLIVLCIQQAVFAEIVAPVNDECSGAIPFAVIPTDQTCVTVSGTTATATTSMSACTGSNSNDVWYSFVAPATSVVANITNVITNGSTSATVAYQIFSGSCGALTSIKCSDSSTGQNVVSGLITGSTYYIRVHDYFSFYNTTTFTICLRTQILNDECTGAIAIPAITNNQACTNVQGDITLATNSQYTCVGSSSSRDLWYSFVAPTTSLVVSVTSGSVSYEIFSGSCGNLTSLKCSNSQTITSGLTVGNTYFLKVADYYSSVSTAAFTICLRTQMLNDECTGAIAIPVITNNQVCTNVQGDITLATNSQYTCVGSSSSRDLWYSFVAPTTSLVVSVTSGSVSYEIFSGSCGNLTSLKCSGSQTVTSGLTVGNTYFLKVADYYSSVSTAAFTICLRTQILNDECTGAIAIPAITNNQACTNVQGDITLATNSQYTCVGSSSSRDLWYSFVAPTTSLVVSVTSGSVSHEIFSGSCGNLSSLKCSNSQTVTSGLTVGNTYFLKVADYYSSASTAAFTICLRTQILNDECTGAIAIPAITNNQTCTNVQGDITLATNSQSTCTGNSVSRDLWYSFVAPTTSIVTSVTAGSVSYEIFSGSCGNLTSLKCGVSQTITIGLIIGNTYFLKVADYYSSASTAAFTICLRTQLPNDDCDGATPFPTIPATQSCVFLTGNTNLATGSLAICGGFASNDLWYSFVAPMPTIITQITNISGNADMMHQIYSGTCGNLTSIKCSDPETSTTSGLIPGETYYIRIHNYYTNQTSSFNICLKTPLNDDILNAIPITVGSACSGNSYTNTNATLEVGEPAPSCQASYAKSVWFKFVAPSSGNVLITTDLGTPTITTGILSVFSGNPYGLSTMTQIACDDDGGTANTLMPLIGVPVNAGETYYIRFAGNGTASGNFCIEVRDGTITVPSSATCATTYTKTISDGIQWVNFQNPLTPGAFVVAINPDGNDLGVVTVNMFRTSTIRLDGSGKPYLGRNWAISSTNPPLSPVKVRVYFSDAEFTALSATAGGPSSLANCGISHVPGAPCSTAFTLSGATGVQNLLSQTNAVNLAGTTSYIEFETDEFSSFYVNNNAAVLPIELVSFQVKAEDEKKRVIYWTTAMEQNVRNFEIQRSDDAIHFETIGAIEAKGNTTKQQSYNFDDTNFSNKNYIYYRLKINDLDNYISYSEIVAIVINSHEKEYFSIYPNPIGNELNVVFESNINAVSIEIHDIIGRKMYSNTLENTNTFTIPTANWQNGIYAVSILLENGERIIRRIMK